MTHSHHQVVVTGAGCVSCLGVGQESLRAALRDQKSGLRRITMDPPVTSKTKVGGQIDRTALNPALQAAHIRYNDIALDASALASEEALHQAGMLPSHGTCRSVAVLVGAGASNVERFFQANETFFNKGPRWVRPTTVPRCMNNAISAQLAIRFGFEGPNFVISAACASSTVALGYAFRMIRCGYWDQALCVGADTIFSPFTLAAWDNLGVMSRSADPAAACRPFDAKRDGCIIGEGAAAIFLESADSARNRNASIRAEICGYGESSDALHITTPDAQGQTKAMQDALADAQIVPADLGWVHAHGTGTIANDQVECASLLATLGTAAAAVPVTSLKPYYGHMIGASGTMDLLASIISMEDGLIPASLHLTEPDAAARGLRFAPDTRTPLERPYIMKNSFGFGGSNAVLIVKQS
ncbi:MAG: beta-ketoacyl-[acyl-carrier-protein] synthase family protein [Kiritimatiellia bacterium]